MTMWQVVIGYRTIHRKTGYVVPEIKTIVKLTESLNEAQAYVNSFYRKSRIIMWSTIHAFIGTLDDWLEPTQ